MAECITGNLCHRPAMFVYGALSSAIALPRHDSVMCHPAQSGKGAEGRKAFVHKAIHGARAGRGWPVSICDAGIGNPGGRSHDSAGKAGRTAQYD